MHYFSDWRKCRKEMKRIQGCKIQISLSLPVLLLSFSHLPNGGNGSIYYKCVFMLWSSSVKALVLFHLDISIWSLQYLPFMYVFFFFIGAIHVCLSLQGRPGCGENSGDRKEIETEIMIFLFFFTATSRSKKRNFTINVLAFRFDQVKFQHCCDLDVWFRMYYMFAIWTRSGLNDGWEASSIFFFFTQYSFRLWGERRKTKSITDSYSISSLYHCYHWIHYSITLLFPYIDCYRFQKLNIHKGHLFSV